MKSFKTALNKATARRNNDKPKEKHLITIHNTFSEIPADETKKLILKQLHEKKVTTRIRTLMVIHFLLQNQNQVIRDWLPTFSLQIETHKSCELVQLIIAYYNYLKTKTKLHATLISTMSQSVLQSLKSSTIDLLHKTEEILELMQSLVNLKKPLKIYQEMKDRVNFVNELATRVFMDSKEIYISLKSLMSCLWSTYTTFDAFSASQAEGFFLKYNKIVKSFRNFANAWAEQYPGELPKFSLLSDASLREVHEIVRGKENLNTGVNLMGFESVNKDGSPTKARKSIEVVHEKRPSLTESSFNFHSVPLQMTPMNQIPMMNGVPFYQMAGFYPQMYFNPYYPKYMSIRANKRVSFAEQDLTQEDILNIQKENYLLRGKLFELEQFCEKAEKSFTASAQNSKLIKELSQKNQELLNAETEYKEQISRLQHENWQISQENQKFKQENSELLMKKQILEGEVERLSESIHNFEMQLKKVNFGKVSSAGNPNYVPQKLKMGTLKIPDEVDLRRISVEGGTRGRENRTKLAESHIAKMKNLAGLNYSCKNISSQEFSFTSPGTSPKAFQQTSNVEELKKLIRQAKENHLKLKSTF